MRNAFVKSIIKLAKNDKRIFILVADIGVYLLRDFKKNFPERFINVGVAEANMIGVAAGLAMTGKIPFVYTITPFVTTRCLDQIRVDICYQNLNVRIIGVGSGVSYSTAGPTHHSLEDIALMRVFPNMSIVAPSDSLEMEEITKITNSYAGPMYIRLPLAGDPIVHKDGCEFNFGKVEFILKEGNDIAIIANGVMVSNALDLAKLLKKKGFKSKVLNMHTIKPLDKESILRVATEVPVIVTLEEHNIIGGLGSAISEILSESSFHGVFKRFGFRDKFCEQYGEKKELYEEYGIASDNIFKNVLSILEIRNR